MELKRYQNKALFWRRMAYVYRNGTPEEIRNIDKAIEGLFLEGGTNKMYEIANKIIMPFWEPVYKREPDREISGFQN